MHDAAPLASAGGCRERVGVLDRTLRVDRVIAAVKRRKPKLLQSPKDPAHRRILPALVARPSPRPGPAFANVPRTA